jgi:hypothetical protein
MGVGGCEIKTIGYTCRSVVLTVFGPGFNSRRLHQTTTAFDWRSVERLCCFMRRQSIAERSSYNISLQDGLKANAALISPTWE